jgi:hypothetical protein
LSESYKDKDLELKLRLMRLFWNRGYLVRKDVNLLRFDVGKPADRYTDIDVVCIRHDSSFNRIIEICDCKSGTVAKTAERIFWLSGVMKYFGADKGYFVRNKIFESKYVDLATKLDILPMSAESLTKLETSYDVVSKLFVGCFNKECITYENETFRELKKEIYPVYEYIISKYWMDSAHQQIVSLIDCGSQIKESKLIGESKLFLQMYCLTLLSSSILDFSHCLLQIPAEELENEIKERIYGGKIESHQRLEMLKKFYVFLKKEVEIRYNSKYPVNKEDFISSYYPTYLKHLVDLIQRVCLRPEVFTRTPQLLDYITYEIALNKQSLNKQEISEIFGVNNLHELLKTAKDIIIFAERSEFVDTSLTKKILDNINQTQLQNFT